VVELGGYYMGSMAAFNRVSASLLHATGPPSITYAEQRPWLAALSEIEGAGQLSTKGRPDTVRIHLASVGASDFPLT
jgi:hypothetical protein